MIQKNFAPLTLHNLIHFILRSLPQPILTFKYHEEFIASIKLDTQDRKVKKEEKEKKKE